MPVIAAFQSPATNPSELLTDDRAAELLGIKSQTLAAWRVKGRHRLPFVRVGRCIRYKRADIEAFIESHRESGAPSETV